MKRIVLLLTVLATVFVAVPAFAQDRVDARENRQTTRIVNGSTQGDLTAAEQRRLARQQARIRRAEARAESDGVVTRREQRRLERRQDRASRHIYRARHNSRTAR